MVVAASNVVAVAVSSHPVKKWSAQQDGVVLPSLLQHGAMRRPAVVVYGEQQQYVDDCDAVSLQHGAQNKQAVAAYAEHQRDEPLQILAIVDIFV